MTVITNVENLIHGGRCLVGYDAKVSTWPAGPRWPASPSGRSTT